MKQFESKKERKSSVRYSKVLGNQICGLIEDKMTITELCRMPGMPSRRAVHRWRHKYDDFNLKVKRAEDIRLTSLVDDMIVRSREDVIQVLTLKLGRKPDKLEIHAHVAMLRLQIDTTKFLAAKLYGTRSADIDEKTSSAVINIINYKPVKEPNSPIKIVQDLQPEHLKSVTTEMTPTQIAQMEYDNKK